MWVLDERRRDFQHPVLSCSFPLSYFLPSHHSSLLISLVGEFREEACKDHNSPTLQGANFIGDSRRDSLEVYFILEESV